VRGLQGHRRIRHREKRLVVEGTRLLEEAMAPGQKPDFVLHTSAWAETSSGAALLKRLAVATVPALPVSDQVMASCADTESPQGVLAVSPFPEIAAPVDPTFVLIVDRLRIPGNLGAILRTAAAAGVELVLLPPGNIDPYNPKVIRGGMGAHFQIPILCWGWGEIDRQLRDLEFWLASAGDGVRHNRVDWTRPVALIVGGEASGAGDLASSLVTTGVDLGRTCGYVHIPMPGRIESLNAAVAAGILLFEIVRQRS
jgi:TrmH family RNA methyltransferase